MNHILAALSNNGKKAISCNNKLDVDRLKNYALKNGFEAVPTLVPKQNLEGYSIWKLDADNVEESYDITYTHTEDSERWSDAFLIAHGINPEELGWTGIDTEEDDTDFWSRTLKM